MIGTLSQEEIDRASPGELRAEVALLRAQVKGLMIDNERLGTMAKVAVAARIDRIDEFRNANGDIVSLMQLCREEPEWAANTITRLKAMATSAEMGKMAQVC